MSSTIMTVRKERFAQLMAQGAVSQADAYRQAYDAAGRKPETVYACSSRLMKDAKVLARIAEIRAPVIAEAGITFAGHLKRLKDLGEKAEKAGQNGAAITAEVWRGKVAGLYVDQVKPEDLDKLTEDELEMVTRGKVPPRLKLVGS